MSAVVEAAIGDNRNREVRRRKSVDTDFDMAFDFSCLTDLDTFHVDRPGDLSAGPAVNEEDRDHRRQTFAPFGRFKARECEPGHVDAGVLLRNREPCRANALKAEVAARDDVDLNLAA